MRRHVVSRGLGPSFSFIVGLIAAVGLVASACAGGGASKRMASLDSLSSAIGCVRTVPTADLGFVESGDCWFTEPPSMTAETVVEEVLYATPWPAGYRPEQTVVELTVYVEGFGGQSAEDTADEKFNALARARPCTEPEYSVRGSNWFTDSISDKALADEIVRSTGGTLWQRCVAE